MILLALYPFIITLPYDNHVHLIVGNLPIKFWLIGNVEPDQYVCSLLCTQVYQSNNK